MRGSSKFVFFAIRIFYIKNYKLTIILTLSIVSRAANKSVAIVAVMSVKFIGNVCKYCVSAGVLSVIMEILNYYIIGA